MKNERIIVANLKGQGCATTIRRELMSIIGVDSVQVNLERNTVDVAVRYLDRWVIADRLYSLGYPEITENNNLLLQLKSMASCLAGSMSNNYRERHRVRI